MTSEELSSHPLRINLGEPMGTKYGTKLRAAALAARPRRLGGPWAGAARPTGAGRGGRRAVPAPLTQRRPRLTVSG
jgi:hypothetical protein